MKQPRLHSTVLLLTASGACALVYQVSWLRELRLAFGSTTAASAAVVAIFMGGLGLGNALFGRHADRVKNPLALYAALEGGIVLAAALSPWLIDLIRATYVGLGGQAVLGGLGSTSVRLALSSLVLAAPTILMGGTLPAAIAAATPAEDGPRRAAAVLYGVNTLGAVAGTVSCTFWLLPALGTRWSIWSACVLNAIVSAIAFGISRSRERAPEASPDRSAPPTPAGEVPLPRAWPVYAAAGASGFAFLLMELVWYRMLAPILGGSTYTFGLILAVALLGIGIGGASYSALHRRRLPSLGTLAVTCSLEALLLALPLVIGDALALSAAELHEANRHGFRGEVGVWSLIAAVVILPGSILAGIQFPVFFALLGRGARDVGRQVGWAYAFNTVGSIAGSLAGGFGLLPLLSAVGAWKLVVILLAFLGASLALLGSGGRPRVTRAGVPIALSSIAILALWAPGPTAVWRHSGIGAGRAALPQERTANAIELWKHDRRRETIWEADGVESGVAITATNGLSFLVNGKNDGNSIGDAGTQIQLGMLPAMLHPEPRKCLVVGLGTGETGGWLARVETVDRVDVVEIEPAIDEMARRCAIGNHDVMTNPKVHVVHNDAREVLATTREKYDIIASAPSNPYRSGVANLFTSEFYRAVSDRLAPRGLLAQWLQGYEVDERTVRAVVVTLRSVFSHVEVWQSKHDDMLLVCSNDPFAYDGDSLRRGIAAEPFRSALRAAWRATDIEGLLARYVGGEKLVERIHLEHGDLVNHDDRNHVEYGFARTSGRAGGFDVSRLRDLALSHGADRPTVLLGAVDWEGVEDERLAMYVALDRRVPSIAAGESRAALASRTRAFERYLAGDLPGVVAEWAGQPRPARYATETALLALAHASSGADEAAPLIEQLRSFSSTETAMLRGILLWRQNDAAGAAGELARAFLALRQDPWPLFDVTERAIRSAIEIAQREPVYAPELLDSLREPFAMMYAEERRRAAGCLIAARLSPRQALPWIESYEPHVPWTRAFLELRLAVYTATAHASAAVARTDFERYQRNEGEPR